MHFVNDQGRIRSWHNAASEQVSGNILSVERKCSSAAVIIPNGNRLAEAEQETAKALSLPVMPGCLILTTRRPV